VSLSQPTSGTAGLVFGSLIRSRIELNPPMNTRACAARAIASGRPILAKLALPPT
jgi:hypothetical protein